MYEDRIEKAVSRDHRLSSLGKPRDAKRQSTGKIFLSYPHTHDRFLYTFLCQLQVKVYAQSTGQSLKQACLVLLG